VKLKVSLTRSDAVREAEGEETKRDLHTKGKCMALLSLVDS